MPGIENEPGRQGTSMGPRNGEPECTDVSHDPLWQLMPSSFCHASLKAGIANQHVCTWAAKGAAAFGIWPGLDEAHSETNEWQHVILLSCASRVGCCDHLLHLPLQETSD